MEYQQKYHKYKSKYLNLQFGGNRSILHELISKSTEDLVNSYLATKNQEIITVLEHRPIDVSVFNDLPVEIKKRLTCINNVTINDLPYYSNAHRIDLADNVNQNITEDMFPKTVKCISFGLLFNSDILSLPSSINIVIFRSHCIFNKPLINLPEHLNSLIFESYTNFNNELRIPQSLKVLKLSDRYNRLLMFINTNIEHLECGNDFNQILSYQSFPVTLKYLKFGNRYNQIIRNNLFPNQLEHLQFGDDYNQLLPILPSKLKTLKLGFSFDKRIDNIPNTVEYLELMGMFNNIITRLPSNLKTLHLSNFYNKPFKLGVLQEGLKEIIFGDDYDQSFEPGVIPSTVEKIVFGKWFNKKIHSNVYPVSLKYLEFGETYNQTLDRLPNIETLIFGKNYNRTLNGSCLPLTVKKIHFGYYYTKQILNLPDSVQEIIFEGPYDFSLAYIRPNIKVTFTNY